MSIRFLIQLPSIAPVEYFTWPSLLFGGEDPSAVIGCFGKMTKTSKVLHFAGCLWTILQAVYRPSLAPFAGPFLSD